jgi:CO/xanthine dehydrogenase Mo-binding subunit
MDFEITSGAMSRRPAAARVALTVNGETRVLGCLTLGVACGGRAISLIEGLAADGDLHPMQQAFIEQDAVTADAPDVTIESVDLRDDVVGQLGAKGVGAFGQMGTAAAIANAVFQATGLRIRELPMAPALVMDPVH